MNQAQPKKGPVNRSMVGVPHNLKAKYIIFILIAFPISERNIKRLYCIRPIFHRQDYLWSAVITRSLCKCVNPGFTFILLRHKLWKAFFVNHADLHNLICFV